MEGGKPLNTNSEGVTSNVRRKCNEASSLHCDLDNVQYMLIVPVGMLPGQMPSRFVKKHFKTQKLNKTNILIHHPVECTTIGREDKTTSFQEDERVRAIGASDKGPSICHYETCLGVKCIRNELFQELNPQTQKS
ncbi:hypothetical protein CEXT_117681 [Caerostris extrusa]|uniref:Uncharacterized protein n=1 Tax=Caerostris extrusa TaxID=172846 RepID=A0AAV4R186_CAEEX|nr:hypothetical protein CEXT_117681 [Caerostris extrusa]